MITMQSPCLLRFLAKGFILFALCCFLRPIDACGASLIVKTVDGKQHVHDLAIVEYTIFSGEAFEVVTAYSAFRYPLESINEIDFAEYPTGVDDPAEMPDVAKAVHLFQNYPNPFNPATQIDFTISLKGWVRLRIYSVRGQLVRTLIDKYMEAGPQSLLWDGCDDAGNSVASGVYFYSLVASGVQESRKMILLR